MSDPVDYADIEVIEATGWLEGGMLLNCADGTQVRAYGFLKEPLYLRRRPDHWVLSTLDYEICRMHTRSGARRLPRKSTSSATGKPGTTRRRSAATPCRRRSLHRSKRSLKPPARS
jgi:hypothetical protein